MKNNALTITYNNGQHATYQLSNMQAGTTFELQTEKDPSGGHVFTSDSGQNACP